LRTMLQSHLEQHGYSNSRVDFVKTASRTNSMNMKIKVKRKRDKEMSKHYAQALGA
jgi:hypothetical protein